MRTLIVGSDGSMGKRYQAILDHLEEPYFKTDLKHTDIEYVEIANSVDGIIICTPTDSHLDMVKMYAPFGKPILCEKPLAKNLEDVRAMLSVADHFKTPLDMVMQYEHLLPDYVKSSVHESFYDYFRHGSDGLYWDCMQIIALANAEVHLSEQSPIWRCSVNGYGLSSAWMDQAYIRTIRHWLEGNGHRPQYLIDIHEKVLNFIALKESNAN